MTSLVEKTTTTLYKKPIPLFLNSSQLLRRLNSTSGFRFGDVIVFKMSKTTSGLEKITSVILEFYFRVLFRPYRHNRNVILHQLAKLHRNRATAAEKGRLIDFQDGNRGGKMLLPVSD